MWKLLKHLLSKPRMMTHTPPKAPTRHRGPDVTITRAAGPTFTLNLFQWHRHAAPARPAPRRVQAARQRITAARQATLGQRHTARPGEAAAMWQRRQALAERQAQQERARQEAAERGAVSGRGRKTEIVDPPHEDRGPVAVKSHVRDGHKVAAHERSKPDGD